MINFKDWFGKNVKERIRKKACSETWRSRLRTRLRVLFLISILAIAFCGIMAFMLGHFFDTGFAVRSNHSGSNTVQTGKDGKVIQPAANAWKFADLIQPNILYPIDHVVDGDTLVAMVAGHDVTVRLIGMDTPETVDPRKSVECFGPEASAEAKAIFSGNLNEEVYLEKDPVAGDYDKYGRILAYVRLSDGTLYNLKMIELGFAREYTYMNQAYKYQSDFKSAQKSAKAASLGVWNKKVCPKPFSY